MWLLSAPVTKHIDMLGNGRWRGRQETHGDGDLS